MGGSLGSSGAGSSIGGALASGGVSGSAGSAGTTSISVIPLCQAGKALITDGFNPQASADFVGVYLAQATIPSLYEWKGTACGGAIDVEGCKTAVANALLQTTGFPSLGHLAMPMAPSRSYAFLVITRGDTVTAITDDAGLRLFLGIIDTPNEAALRLFLAAFPVQCAAMTETAEGYSASYQPAFMGCGPPSFSYRVLARRDASLYVDSSVQQSMPCVGRRPDGLRKAGSANVERDVGRYFAEVAHLEAAAVRAFEIMIEDLQRLEAPAELVLRARHARSDEIRHAWAFEALADSLGVARLAVEVEPLRDRTLLEVALENAVEGVVRETWGALSGAWQARHATDEAARRVFESVAEDEAEHAELSLALDDWFATRLNEEELALVEAAKRRALVELRAELGASEPDARLVNIAGVPDRARALDLLARLEADLFSGDRELGVERRRVEAVERADAS
jgi:hypothetical protein